MVYVLLQHCFKDMAFVNELGRRSCDDSTAGAWKLDFMRVLAELAVGATCIVIAMLITRTLMQEVAHT